MTIALNEVQPIENSGNNLFGECMIARRSMPAFSGR